MGAVVRNEQGSVLIMAVIAMLIMGVLSVSFALLADVETRIGVNYKQQGQAEALAEAGLEVARDTIRDAATVAGGFTRWMDGTLASHGLATNVGLGAGAYSAWIDNDCSPLVPTAIQQAGCPTDTDDNEAAVITATATAGTAKAIVRAVVGVDNPWKHVCSNAKPDNNGYCNEPGNRNGNPSITPADPNDPNGPAAYNDLPRPTLGCSRIDPTMHGTTAVTCPPGYITSYTAGTYTAPAGGTATHMVLMGEDANVVGTAKYCYNSEVPGPVGPGKYWGYFDCALQTPCDPAVDTCPNGPKKGCVMANDPRPALLPAWYETVGVNGCSINATGMVFNWYGTAGRAAGGGVNEKSPTFDGQYGTCAVAVSGATRDCAPTGVVDNTNGRNYYILNRLNDGSDQGRASIQKTGGTPAPPAPNAGQDFTFVYGTMVVEGDGGTVPASLDNCPSSNNDLELGNKGVMTAALRNTTEQGRLNPFGVLTAVQKEVYVYGYPTVIVIFDPREIFAAPPRPTVSPYNPQFVCANMASSNSFVNGMVYSGGHVQFNPILINGTLVAFEIQTQGSTGSGVGYNNRFGNATPPPGFPFGAGNQVVIIRKSFIVCSNYQDQSGGRTACQ
ncbi:MAG TPA: pilus assembly PilX N-terminal domain-containing protein [Methylomirabilota bacterium]|jgi:Tfp pilus assembly protein PilX|nr:pilus assembly PilX N-terminal domain-containing protein [Methylomirabilota bacterium]